MSPARPPSQPTWWHSRPVAHQIEHLEDLLWSRPGLVGGMHMDLQVMGYWSCSESQPPAKCRCYSICYMAALVLPAFHVSHYRYEHRAAHRVPVCTPLYRPSNRSSSLVCSVASCLPGHGLASLGHGISPAYDGIHASDRTSLNSCRTFRHESPASVLMNNWP